MEATDSPQSIGSTTPHWNTNTISRNTTRCRREIIDMKSNKPILLLLVIVLLLVPGTASAWLVCDPCCPKKKAIETGQDSKAAMAYAQAGLHFFQGLVELERSEKARAHEAFGKFYKSVKELRSSLDIRDKKLEVTFARLLEGTEKIGAMLRQTLPSAEIITSLGQEWAALQITANKLVAARCK